MKKILRKIFGSPEDNTLKRYQKRLVDVNGLADEYKKISDSALKQKTDEFKRRLDKGESLDDLLPEAFATVREVAGRVLQQRHYDVQIIGGMCLHEGKVAEMKTGEGKTIVATLPLYLNALSGKGAHLVTVNDYLAQIGAGWMAPIYDFLGLSVGVVIPDASFVYNPDYNDEQKDDERLRHLEPCSRQDAYAADITYGTNNEFGFDYLRDNMVRSLDQVRQKELHYAIVDEVDSILIDEARTPLIISAPSVVSNNYYQQFAKIVPQLKTEHYKKDEKMRSVTLTDLGIEEVQRILGIDNLYAVENIKIIFHLEQALKAEILFDKDKNYVVSKDGKVIIVDEFTGRLLPGRRYNEGLHQAIEAKEGVDIQKESMTLAKVSFQNLFRLYEKLSGMTGTAATESEEFYQIYKLEVIEIPTNEPVVRTDHPDIVYRTEKAKFAAIVKKIAELNKKGQPILIGTSSIEKNEKLSKLLKQADVKHQVLNAKNNTREALIVSQAGQKGAVTLATNIAGRGTDIVLGKGVVDLGGLFVLGTERHEARRIDNQLRGRSGRQGDPGESQFFVSTEDDIMRIFGGDKIASIMSVLSSDDSVPIQSKSLSKALEAAQKKVEGLNFDARKNVVQYDDVMNKHRLTTYKIRRQLLEENSDISDRIKDFIRRESRALSDMSGQDDDYEKLLVSIFPLSGKQLDQLFELATDDFYKRLNKEGLRIYKSKVKEFGKDVVQEVQRDIYFQTLDNLWMEHLESMDHMQQGVQWISVGQRDPLVEYRNQAKMLYGQMQTNLRRKTLQLLLSIQRATAQDLARPGVESELTKAAQTSVSGADRIKKQEIIDLDDFDDDSNRQAATGVRLKNVKVSQLKKKRKKERQNRKRGRR